MQGSPKDRLIRATTWHAAGRVLAAVLALATTAYAYAALGGERYGLAATAGALSLALSLVEFGVRTAYVQFVAEDLKRGDRGSARAVLATGTLLYGAVGAAVVLPFVLFARPVVEWFGAEGEMVREGVDLFRISAAVLVLGNLATGWSAVLVALQRTAPLAAGMVVGEAVKTAATVLAIRSGMGAVSLGVGAAAGLVVTAAVQAAAAHRAFPGMSLLPVHATRAALRRIGRLGAALQVARVAEVVVFQLDQVLVARFLGLEAGGIYRLGSELVLKMRDAPLLLATGVLPAAAEIRVLGDSAALRNLYVRGTKYVVAAAACGAAFFAAAAPAVLLAWTGKPESAAAAPVVALLLAGYFANVAVGVGCQVGLVLGQAGLQARAGVLSGVLSVALVWAALRAGLGLPGAAAANAVALLAGPAWYLLPLHRALGVATGEALRRAYLPPLLPAAAVGGAVLLLHAGPLRGWLAAGRVPALGALAAEGAVLGAAYLAVLLAFGWADAFDRDVLRRSLGRPPREGAPC